MSRWPKRLLKRTRSGRKRSRPPQSASVDQFCGESYSQRMSMPPMLTEAARTLRPRLSKSKNKKSVDPSRVLHVLGDHILLDGFKIVLDQEKSRGSYLYDAANGHRLIDLYGFFGSMTIGFNHPYFDQTRVSCPFIDFAWPEGEREKAVIAREKKSEQEVRDYVDKRKIDICAIIIEPIQGEGGDNHFRGEWLKKLREICDENKILLIFDEVQCGMGATGKMWCCHHFDMLPH